LYASLAILNQRTLHQHFFIGICKHEKVALVGDASLDVIVVEIN
jgi:hypothetical protein